MWTPWFARRGNGPRSPCAPTASRPCGARFQEPPGPSLRSGSEAGTGNLCAGCDLMMCSVELAGRHINARARGPHVQAQSHSRRTRASRFLCTNRRRGTWQAGSLLSWGPARTRLALVDAVALRYLLRGLGLFDGRFQHILQPALPAPSCRGGERCVWATWAWCSGLRGCARVAVAVCLWSRVCGQDSISCLTSCGEAGQCGLMPHRRRKQFGEHVATSCH